MVTITLKRLVTLEGCRRRSQSTRQEEWKKNNTTPPPVMALGVSFSLLMYCKEKRERKILYSTTLGIGNSYKDKQELFWGKYFG